MNAVFLISIFYIFFAAVLQNARIALAATFVMLISAGPATFGMDLYWQYWIMLAPLLSVPILIAGRTGLYLLLAFISGLLYFGTRYEFATTFALMWLFPVVLAANRGMKRPVPAAIGGFVAVCLSFVIALAYHHYRVSHVEEDTFSGASQFIFESLGLRMASLEGAPFPGSIAFLKNIAFRMTKNAFSFEDVFSLSRV